MNNYSPWEGNKSDCLCYTSLIGSRSGLYAGQSSTYSVTAVVICKELGLVLSGYNNPEISNNTLSLTGALYRSLKC